MRYYTQHMIRFQEYSCRSERYARPVTSEHPRYIKLNDAVIAARGEILTQASHGRDIEIAIRRENTQGTVDAVAAYVTRRDVDAALNGAA